MLFPHLEYCSSPPSLFSLSVFTNACPRFLSHSVPSFWLPPAHLLSRLSIAECPRVGERTSPTLFFSFSLCRMERGRRRFSSTGHRIGPNGRAMYESNALVEWTGGQTGRLVFRSGTATAMNQFCAFSFFLLPLSSLVQKGSV